MKIIQEFYLALPVNFIFAILLIDHPEFSIVSVLQYIWVVINIKLGPIKCENVFVGHISKGVAQNVRIRIRIESNQEVVVCQDYQAIRSNDSEIKNNFFIPIEKLFHDTSFKMRLYNGYFYQTAFFRYTKNFVHISRKCVVP